jgi:pimeloyl-ACP methyl ester carboxylesterase
MRLRLQIMARKGMLRSCSRQPTLVLMGRDDPLVPSVNGCILARLIPNARLQIIDNGHLFMVTRPIETAMASRAIRRSGDGSSAAESTPVIIA